jgi:hypothetical protein
MNKEELKVSIVPQGGPWSQNEIHLSNPDDHFHVCITNISTSSIRLWKEWCSWGYFSLSFEVVLETGEGIHIHKKCGYWTYNSPDFIVLLPQEPMIFNVSFKNKIWRELTFSSRECY